MTKSELISRFCIPSRQHAVAVVLTVAFLCVNPGTHSLAHLHEETGCDEVECPLCLALAHSPAIADGIVSSLAGLEELSEDLPRIETVHLALQHFHLPVGRGPPA
jgi:hypothetical protein